MDTNVDVWKESNLSMPLPQEASEAVKDKLVRLGITAQWIKPYLYEASRSKDGVVKYDVSAVGINEIATRLGISIVSIETIEETVKHIVLRATAVNPQGVQAYGVAMQEKSGRYYLPMVYSKAQRNARKQLIPMAIMQLAVTELFGGNAQYDAEGVQDGSARDELEKRIAKGHEKFREQQARIDTLEGYIKSHDMPLPEDYPDPGEEAATEGATEDDIPI